MKIHLAQIPDSGLRQPLRLELRSMARLGEVIGPQEGLLTGEVWIKNREGSVEIVGTLRASLQPPCQRCLEPVPLEIDEEVLVALVPEKEYDDAPEEAHLGLGELEVSFYTGEELDLTHILEDELLLLIPEPVAEEDDEGRCTVCGRPVDEVLPETQEAASEDNPFAALKDLIRSD